MPQPLGFRQAMVMVVGLSLFFRSEGHCIKILSWRAKDSTSVAAAFLDQSVLR
jgi:hypothetical protein